MMANRYYELMAETKIIAMPVPRLLAADVQFYTGETGLFLNDKDLVLTAVRSLFLDTYNGYDKELEEWMKVYRNYEAYGPELGRLEVEVPEELFDAITDIYPDRGYGFSEFVCIALTRQISFLTQYCEDELS